MTIIGIGLCGAFGVVLRYLIEKNLVVESSIPISTLLINVFGSLLIGVLFVLTIEKNQLPRDIFLFAGVGFLGGFTTFSAYALQCLNLARDGQWAPVGLYFVGSPVLALGAAWLGLTITKLFF